MVIRGHQGPPVVIRGHPCPSGITIRHRPCPLPLHSLMIWCGTGWCVKGQLASFCVLVQLGGYSVQVFSLYCVIYGMVALGDRHVLCTYSHMPP